MLAPLAAVLMFFVAIVTAFGYLRTEEIDREQEAVQRDVEYTQQRLRLRLLERQEQLTRVAREIANRELESGGVPQPRHQHGEPVRRNSGPGLD